MATVSGRDLRVGDTIEVWWSSGRDTITALRPYRGPLAHIFPDGAQLAEFAVFKTGMTIENNLDYEVVARGPRESVHDLADTAYTPQSHRR